MQPRNIIKLSLISFIYSNISILPLQTMGALKILLHENNIEFSERIFETSHSIAGLQDDIFVSKGM